MCRGDTDWHRGTARSLASGRYQSRFVTKKSHIRISDLLTGLHDPTFHSTCCGRLRRLLRRHAMKQAATASVLILSRSLCLWSSCTVRRIGEQVLFLFMFCNQFYLKLHKLCLLLCWKINSETDLYARDSILRQKAGPLSAPFQQTLSTYLNAPPRLCNGHCHHCHYVTGCCGYKFFRANSKACSFVSKHFVDENGGMEFGFEWVRMRFVRWSPWSSLSSGHCQK